MAYVARPRLGLVHVGDTRCDLSTGDGLQPLIRDHTLGFRLEGEGDLEGHGPDRPDAKNVLSNASSAEAPLVRTDVTVSELASEGTLLSCSDGLHERVPERRITAILA